MLMSAFISFSVQGMLLEERVAAADAEAAGPDAAPWLSRRLAADAAGPSEPPPGRATVLVEPLSKVIFSSRPKPVEAMDLR
jgi:hypothetical protein